MHEDELHQLHDALPLAQRIRFRRAIADPEGEAFQSNLGDHFGQEEFGGV